MRWSAKHCTGEAGAGTTDAGAVLDSPRAHVDGANFLHYVVPVVRRPADARNGFGSFGVQQEPRPVARERISCISKCELCNSVLRRPSQCCKSRPAGLCGLSTVHSISAWPQAPECYNSRLSGAPGATTAGGTGKQLLWVLRGRRVSRPMCFHIACRDLFHTLAICRKDSAACACYLVVTCRLSRLY